MVQDIDKIKDFKKSHYNQKLFKFLSVMKLCLVYLKNA